MSDMLTPAAQTQYSNQQLESTAAQDLASGMKRDEVIRKLMRGGLNAPDAMQMVNRLQTKQSTSTSPPPPPQSPGMRPTPRPQVQLSNGDPDLASSGMRNLLIGAVICIIGTAITIGTYSQASSSPGGGRYTVCWGAMIFGALQAIKGLVTWLQNR